MEHIYFKGLEELLNQGCYIKIYSRVLFYVSSFVVDVEKYDLEAGENKQVFGTSGNENDTILLVLDKASKMIDETSDVPNDKNLSERTVIDRNVDLGYTLFFFKLANNKVLVTICDTGYGNYIPIKSIISDNIQTAFETLNATLIPFKYDCGLGVFGFAEEQTTPVREYQMKLSDKKKRK